jgi:hypothetical protein
MREEEVRDDGGLADWLMRRKVQKFYDEFCAIKIQ